MTGVEARKTVNIALIGGGFMGKEHSKAYALAPVSCPDIAATPIKKILCDINAEKAAENARLWGYEEYTSDYKEILNRDDIDIVDICSPAFMHADMAIEFIKAGKYVFCEKPLVPTVEEAERLMAAVHEYNARTAVGFNKRRWPAVQYARQLVSEGVIGKVLLYNGRYCQGGARTMARGPGRLNWEEGGGFADSGSHVIDMCRHILGDQYESLVAKAHPLYGPLPQRPPKEGEDPSTIPMISGTAEDFSLIIAQMKSGATASLYSCSVYSGSGEDISFEVHGTKGTIRWSGSRPSDFQICVSGKDKTQHGFKTILMGFMHPYGNCVPPMPGFGVGVADNMALQVYEVVNSYVNQTKYDPDFADAVEIVKICDAVRESQNTKQWVTL